MTHEHPHRPIQKKPYEVYGFTEKECLYWRVSQERFDTILHDELTVIHNIQESSNNYGEFIFVTTSRQSDQRRTGMTFFGLGFHEYRERWFTNEWYWYQANIQPQMMGQQIPKDEVDELLKARLEIIEPYVDSSSQSERGRLFELLADLTDEDGALAELQDLGDDWGQLLNGMDE
jgi:hypothetical protein